MATRTTTIQPIDAAPPNGSEFAPIQRGYTVADLDVIAERIAASRLFPGLESKQAVFALMLICQSEGLHPAQAMKRYHIIKGRPSMRSDAMLAEYQRHGGTVRWDERSDTRVAATFFHPVHAKDGVAIVWDMQRASRAGITINGTWKQYPCQMLTARVISEGVRLVLPGVVAGIYTPEEVNDMTAPIVPVASPEPTSFPTVIEPRPSKSPEERYAAFVSGVAAKLGIDGDTVRECFDHQLARAGETGTAHDAYVRDREPFKAWALDLKREIEESVDGAIDDDGATVETGDVSE